jgi:hypothetical protein
VVSIVQPPLLWSLHTTAVTTTTETPASDEGRVTAETGQLEDEYISLTFSESDGEEDEEWDST